MNRRIKELMQTAYQYAVVASKTEQHACVLGSDYFQLLEKQKFAELIVADATECVRGVLREENSTLSYEDATAIQDSINQTFGIKSWRDKFAHLPEERSEEK